jgi:hypothetical protein
MAAEQKEESQNSARFTAGTDKQCPFYLVPFCSSEHFSPVLKQLEQNPSSFSTEETNRLVEDCTVAVKSILNPEVSGVRHPSEVTSVLKVN